MDEDKEMGLRSSGSEVEVKDQIRIGTCVNSTKTNYKILNREKYKIDTLTMNLGSFFVFHILTFILECTITGEMSFISDRRSGVTVGQFYCVSCLL